MKIVKAVCALLCLCMLFAFAACSVSVSEKEQDRPTEMQKFDYELADESSPEYFYRCQLIRQDFAQDKYKAYKGKTVHLRGVYQTDNYHFLIFYDPSQCCNPVDFEILYGGSYPAAGSEIEVFGAFDYYSDSYGTYPVIAVKNLTVISPPKTDA